MHRGDLTNAEWTQLQLLLPPQKPWTGRPAEDHWRIINGMLWIARTGAPWRDLPERYGPSGTVSSRFYRWRKLGLWDRLLATLQQQVDADGKLDWDVHFVDGSSVRAHQHAAGAKGGTRKPKPWGVAAAASVPKFICEPRVGANRSPFG
jgi:transposase